MKDSLLVCDLLMCVCLKILLETQVADPEHCDAQVKDNSDRSALDKHKPAAVTKRTPNIITDLSQTARYGNRSHSAVASIILFCYDRCADPSFASGHL